MLEAPDIIKLEQESEEGNVEYKVRLTDPTEERLEHLVTQMKYRLTEGHGEAFYEIGVDDSGFPKGLSEEDLKASISTLQKMASELKAEISAVVERKGECGKVAQVLVRQYGADVCIDVRVAVCGNVDSGKSTLISVLTRGIYDNGRGSSRAHVFQHKHEVETGRTSSISIHSLGFDAKGKVVNSSDSDFTSEELLKSSKKLITFIDLAGHEKYLKTTVTGLTSQHPDYSLLVVAANMGVTRMAKEHLGVALALKIPVILVITKIDICPANVLQETLQNLFKLLKLPGVKKVPCLIKSLNDVMTCVRSNEADRISPIFLVSNVTGKNMDLLKQFLNFLPAKREWKIDAPCEVIIDKDFEISNVGTVVSGTVLSGIVRANSILQLGPDNNGEFVPVQVKTIQMKQVPVRSVHAGQSVTMALKKLKKASLRKGMVLLDPSLEPVSYWEFDVDLLVLYHSTAIKLGYQAVMHCLNIRQSCRMIWINCKDSLQTGERARCRFRFMFRPEYIKPKSRVIFREGRTKCVGSILHVTNTPISSPLLPTTTTHPTQDGDQVMTQVSETSGQNELSSSTHLDFTGF